MPLHTNQKSLKVIELNVRSLIKRSRRHDMCSFLQQHQPDVLLLCETQLRSEHRVEFKDYEFIRKDKVTGTMRTGSAILVKSKLSHHIIDTNKWNLKSLECTSIRIFTAGSPISLVSAYRNPTDYTNYSLCDDLNTIIAKLEPVGPFIIGGDLNARHTSWLNTKNCAHGSRLDNWYQTNMLNLSIKLYHSQKPTFYRGNIRSHLDLFIVSDNISVQSPPNLAGNLAILDYPSDHRAVLLVTGTANEVLLQEPQKLLDYGKTNWKNYHDAVEEGCHNVRVLSERNMTPSEIDLAVDDLTQLVNRTTQNLVPVRTLNKNTLLKLPQIILDLIAHKKSLRRRWQRHHYDPNDHLLKSEIKCVDKIIQDRLVILHNERFTKALQDLRPDSNVFKNINQLTSRQKRTPLPSLSHQGTIIDDDFDKANLIGAHFENVHQQNLQLGDATFTSTVNTTVNGEFRNNHTPKVLFTAVEPANPTNGFNPDRHLTSTDNTRHLIKSRQNKKSSGKDNIPNFIIRKLGPIFSETLSTLFNQAYNINYFPTAWKQAKIIPICKPNKPADSLDSYRPISLLSCMSKIFECAIKDKLVAEIEDKGILPEDQFGFRSRRATTHPLVILQNDIISAIQKKTPTVAVSLDIAKAFDTTWVEGLIFKLAYTYNLDRHLCGTIHNFMMDRTFNVQVGKTQSNTFSVAAGVPQGGVLSAILFILFIADMPKPPEHINPIKRLQFADDTLIYVSVKNLLNGVSRLNIYISELMTYQDRWKIRCSPTKCESIVFRGPGRVHSPAVFRACKDVTVRVGSQLLCPKKTIRYLGITFSYDTKHIRHIDEILRKANAAAQAVKSILRRTTGATLQVRRLCYKQLVRPVIAYGFACWSGISSHQMERLRILERKILRQITNTRRQPDSYKYTKTSKLYESAEIQPIDFFLAEQACKFFTNVDFDNTPLLKSCFPLEGETIENGEFNVPYLIKQMHDHNELITNGLISFYHRRHRSDNPNTPQVYIRS